MEASFWHERWANGQIKFNQAEPNTILVEHWSRLGCPPEGSVFVPLCGKTVDMAWLRSQGHHVIGNELSDRAISDFFEEQKLITTVRSNDGLTRYTTEGYELWSGDFFDLPASAVQTVGAVYDRASLVALPPDLRQRYAEHLTEIVPPNAPIFLIAFEYDQAEMNGPPFSVSLGEIESLYGHVFDVEQVASLDRLDSNHDLRNRGLTRLEETLVILRRKSQS